MEFKNKKNKSFITFEGQGAKSKIVWDSRSVVVNSTIIILKDDEMYALICDRGPDSDVAPNLTNLPAGYLDRNETTQEAVVRETWEETGLNVNHLLNDPHKYEVINNYMNTSWTHSSDPDGINQNVSIKYGLLVKALTDTDFPKLTNEHNDVPNETVNPRWMPLDDVEEQKWAFNHDKTIEEFLYKITVLDNPKELLRDFSDYITSEWANPDIDDDVINEFMIWANIK